MTTQEASKLLDSCVRMLSEHFEAVQIAVRLPSKEVYARSLGGKIKMSVQQRFDSKIDKSGGENKCWLWTGHTSRWGGHGQLNIGGKLEYAHRLAWQFNNGAIPNGMCVCHKCDVPRCCNPAHLFLGTASENFADMRRKGRGKPPPVVLCGEDNSTAKLTNNQVSLIRSEYELGGISQAKLGMKYSVSESNIQSIVNRLTWKHLP